jgi:hypothetical protein
MRHAGSRTDKGLREDKPKQHPQMMLLKLREQKELSLLQDQSQRQPMVNASHVPISRMSQLPNHLERKVHVLLLNPLTEEITWKLKQKISFLFLRHQE